jgi:FkbM family methyltransferase
MALRDFVPSRIRRAARILLVGERTTRSQISADIRRKIPNENLQIFFDVGAHYGETVHSILREYPTAAIYSFEPSFENFLSLKSSVPHVAKIFNIGLGSSDTEKRFDNTNESNAMFSIANDQTRRDLPTVQIRRIDTLCRELGVAAIDYLKSDTEGHDLEVLKGAIGLIKDNRIKIIECECGVNRENTYHAPLFQIDAYLQDYGYRVFGIYEQVPEWSKRQPHLQRVNAVFISREVIDRNTGAIHWN